MRQILGHSFPSMLRWRHSAFSHFQAAIPKTIREYDLQRRLGGMEFAVVSNNCWGAHIYKNAGIPYSTPFVGVALAPDDYLMLLENWEWIRTPLDFRPSSTNKDIERMRQERGTLWPIGVLAGEVEIQFMHEQNRETALGKWERRLQRMPDDRSLTFLKFDDADYVSDEQVARFHALKFHNKVFFSADRRRSLNFPNTIHIPMAGGTLPDGWSLARVSPLYFDSVTWINKQARPRSGWCTFA